MRLTSALSLCHSSREGCVAFTTVVSPLDAMQDVSDAEAAAPVVIRDEPLLTVWFRPDKGFRTPKAVVCVLYTRPDHWSPLLHTWLILSTMLAPSCGHMVFCTDPSCWL